MSICDDCPYKEQIKSNTKKVTTLDKELAITKEIQDLKYQTIIDLLTDIKSEKASTNERLSSLERAEPLNKYKTNKSLNWIEGLTIGKILAIGIAILTLVAMIKG